jgi:pyrroline-5-carboxylate reductase
MTIGIIGAGGIGQAFAAHMAKAGNEVIVSNSRGPESLAEVVRQLGPRARAGTRQEAAQADVVVVAVIPTCVTSRRRQAWSFRTKAFRLWKWTRHARMARARARPREMKRAATFFLNAY